MADDSDTEVVINQHDEESERDLTERDELRQGDIYSQQKEGQEPYMLKTVDLRYIQCPLEITGRLPFLKILDCR